MCALREFFVVVDRTIRGRILHKCAKNRVIKFEIGKIAGHDFDPKWFRAGLHNIDGLRMAIVRHEKSIPRAAAGDHSYSMMAESHCFGGGGCFVE